MTLMNNIRDCLLIPNCARDLLVLVTLQSLVIILSKAYPPLFSLFFCAIIK